jgi:hypothetical protein
MPLVSQKAMVAYVSEWRAMNQSHTEPRGVRSSDPGRQIQICAWPIHHFLTFGKLGGADVISIVSTSGSTLAPEGPTLASLKVTRLQTDKVGSYGFS